ncbi:MAG: hypothetical protein WA738_04770 [Candidatus Angelobacter sp.]
MSVRQLIYGLWFAGIGLQAALSAVLLGKKMWRQFPVFTGYSLFCLVQSILTYALRGTPQLYSYVYWVCEATSFILGLAVIYEIFKMLLISYPALHRLARRTFEVTVIFLLLLACGVVYFQTAIEGSKFVAGFVLLEQATRIAQVGLVIFLFSFSRAFGLGWRQHLFGIALGLGVFTTVELVSITMRAHIGILATPTFNVVRALSYDASVLVWIGYILLPERVTGMSDVPKRAQLEQWNQAVMELISR